MLNWADYTIIALLALSIMMGLWHGFIAEVIALACWICAFWVAWMFGPALANRLSGSVSTPSVRILLAYALCFIAVLIAGSIVSYLMRKLVEGSGLSGSDRLLGMVFGLARGLGAVVLLVMVLEQMFSRDPWWRESKLLPEFKEGAHWVAAHLPQNMAQDMTQYLDNLLKPLQQPPPPPSSPPLTAPGQPAAPQTTQPSST